VQEFDFDTDSEGDEPIKLRSKQLERPLRVIPTGSGLESSESSDSGSEDGDKRVKGKTTIANMEARSRAMDAEAVREAELDMHELQDAVAAGEGGDDDFDGMDGDEDGAEDGGPSEPVKILTPAQREAEKKAGGPDLITVQRRLRYCVRALENFRKFAEGRYGGHALRRFRSLITPQAKSRLRIPVDI